MNAIAAVFFIVIGAGMLLGLAMVWVYDRGLSAGADEGSKHARKSLTLSVVAGEFEIKFTEWAFFEEKNKIVGFCPDGRSYLATYDAKGEVGPDDWHRIDDQVDLGHKRRLHIQVNFLAWRAQLAYATKKKQ